MESVTIITEPLLHRDFVQFEIVVPILERLGDQYDITIAAPRISSDVREELERRGIRAADGGAIFPRIRRSRDEIPSFICSWARDSIWGWNRRDIERALRGTDGLRINISMTTAIDADVWLIQSRPLGVALDVMRHGVNRTLRLALTAANPFVGHLDLNHLLDAGHRARVRYSTTQHVADWFESKGLPVKGVMPMYYRPTIRQTSQNASRDYIFVYVGKETDSTALRLLLETGLPITMFGSKSAGWVVKALHLERYPNAHLLGHVTDEELSDLYSNARFTAFPFTEEPFGLVPLESMACGTPVLTYGMQGPGESVLDGRTGWLIRSPQEFVRRAVEIWNAGFPTTQMVDRCLVRARGYHLDSVREGWNQLIETAFESSYERIPRLPARPWVRPEPSLGSRALSPASWFASVSGPDWSVSKQGIRPRLSPDSPAGFTPGLSPSSPSLSRSGAYYETPEPEQQDYTTGEDLGGNLTLDSAGPKAPRETEASRSSAALQRASPDGASSNPL